MVPHCHISNQPIDLSYTIRLLLFGAAPPLVPLASPLLGDRERNLALRRHYPTSPLPSLDAAIGHDRAKPGRLRQWQGSSLFALSFEISARAGVYGRGAWHSRQVTRRHGFARDAADRWGMMLWPTYHHNGGSGTGGAQLRLAAGATPCRKIWHLWLWGHDRRWSAGPWRSIFL
jgi:hypothetical protein